MALNMAWKSSRLKKFPTEIYPSSFDILPKSEEGNSLSDYQSYQPLNYLCREKPKSSKILSETKWLESGKLEGTERHYSTR